MKKTDYAAVACLAAITYLSLTPLPEPQLFPGSDKIHHLIAYSFLAFFATYARISYPVILLVGSAVVMYGGLIEIIQPYVNRVGDWYDFGANAAGCTIGIIIVLLVSRIRKRFPSA